ncbi:MAG: ABC transporter permease [Clostridiales bacterium]|jgi:NitT/TauT family transport system permease protein|nr:ABC transporter permease [Clostridiales bacterium]
MNESQEFIKYLQSLNHKKVLLILTRVAILLVLVILWQVLADVRIIDPFITSSPKRVMDTLVSLYKSDSLFYNIFITVSETVIGFVMGTFAGTLVAMALWWTPTISKIIDPYLIILNALPKVAFGPLILVWAGIGVQSIIIMTLAISLISTVISVYTGFIQTDEEKLILVKAFGAKKSQLFRKVVLPSSYDSIVGSLKINISLSWVGVIMGEFLVSKAGLGYLIMYGYQVFNLNLVMTGVLLVAISAALMYFGVSAIERHIGKKFNKEI